MNAFDLKTLQERATKAVEHGHLLGAKCDECGEWDMPVAVGYPGSPKTFRELEDMEAQSEMAEEMARLTGQFQILMSNIMANPDSTAAEKASQANALVAEFSSLTGDVQPDSKEQGDKAGRRLNRQHAGVLRNIHSMLSKMLGWAEYQDDTDDKALLSVDKPHGGDGEHQHAGGISHTHAFATHDDDGKGLVEMTGGKAFVPFASSDKPHGGPEPHRHPDGTTHTHERGTHEDGKKPAGADDGKSIRASIATNLEINGRAFKVFTDPSGAQRWLAYSSNAFEDLDKELFTTEALKEAVAHSDKTGERGPLLIYHVPSAEVGQCDFQAVTSRFLVESGTFDDTPLGRKALDYFVKSDEDHQMSIGYQYRPGDELDGQYDWLRVIERSVCPYGTAANPWTDFQLIASGKEKNMDANKTAVLEKIFGAELAAGIISRADEKTKELEASTRFKELGSADGDGSEKPSEGEGNKEGEPESGDGSPSVTVDQVAALGGLISDLTAQVEALAPLPAVVEALATQVKELKMSDDEKIAGLMAPRVAAMINATGRPTESETNKLDTEAVKELNLDGIKETQQANPALKYLEQVVGPTAAS